MVNFSEGWGQEASGGTKCFRPGKDSQVRTFPRDGAWGENGVRAQQAEGRSFSKGLGQVASEGTQYIRPWEDSPLRTFPRDKVKMVLGVRDNKIRVVNFSKGWGQEASGVPNDLDPGKTCQGVAVGGRGYTPPMVHLFGWGGLTRNVLSKK